MPRLPLPLLAALVACNPPPKEAAMRNPSPVPETAAPGSRGTSQEGAGSAAPSEKADQGALSETGPTAESRAPARRADSPAEAEGRRTLTTAFVRVGPDGHLTVELRDGRTLVLRDVVMQPRDFCGVQVLGGPAGKAYCGGYGDVAAARPGGGPNPGAPDPSTLNPAERPPAKRD